MLHWTYREGTVHAYRQLVELRKKKCCSISQDAITHILVTMVERDGNNLELWNELALALGPVVTAKTTTTRRSKRCDRGKACLECRRLAKGWYIDHRKTERRKTKRSWWGHSSAEWWDSTFFSFPSSLLSSKPPDRKTIRAMAKELKTAMIQKENNEKQESSSEGVGDDARRRDRRSDEEGIGWKLSSRPVMDVSWMWPIEASDLDEEDHHHYHHSSDEEEEEDSASVSEGGSCLKRQPTKPSSFNDLLPERQLDDYCDTVTRKTRGRPPKHLHNTNHESYLSGMIVSKVIIVSHLYTVCHPFVDMAVWWLATRSCRHIKLRKQEDCVELTMLKWLSRQGLNINAILRDYQKKSRKKAPKKDRNNYQFLEIL